MDNLFNQAWKQAEQEKIMPEKLNNIIELEYADFKAKILSGEENFSKKIISSLYDGDAYIIKNAFDKEFLEEVKQRTFTWGQSVESSFHKCLEGTPNFNRIVDESLRGQYNSKSIWHQHLFYRWNGDVFGLFEPIYERWRVMKTLWGLHPDEYEKNTPKDGVVDRLHIYKYPHGGGYLETHSDPYKFQKTIIVIIMSQKGKEYDTGGVYFVDKNDKKIHIEENLNIGDMYFAFPTVLHGVDPIDPHKEVNWDTIDGRWMLGLYSMNSDHVENRHTVHTKGDS